MHEMIIETLLYMGSFDIIYIDVNGFLMNRLGIELDGSIMDEL